MRVVLDVNVLVAAFGTRGACAEIYEHVAARHLLVVSEALIADLGRILAVKFRQPPDRVWAIVESVRAIAVLVEPATLADPVCRDPDDDVVIGTALAGDARCIVTGDEDLLVLLEHASVMMLRPRAFWAFERG